MAKRENELFIGTDFLTKEGRAIKHPALIRKYATVNANKIKKEKLTIAAIDLETNHLTGELKLLGFYDGKNYSYYTNDFLNYLFSWVRWCKSDGSNLAYWNRLDPFILFKQFLLAVEDGAQQEALKRFSKISGEWDKKNKNWSVSPVIEVQMGRHRFGIRNAVRSSVQFFYYELGDEEINTVWAYDIAQLFPGGLEKEATKRFDYYSKVDKSAHLVDWERFDTDMDYRNNIVLKSNELDARACHDLAIEIQQDFKAAFGFYPKTLISQGSLARSAIVADLYNQYLDSYSDEKELNKKIGEEIKSIGIMNYYDEWADRFGEDTLKDMYCLFTEAYSGGYIESIRYGYAKSGWYADIASAYPGVIQNLYDLRKADITKGTGTPPNTKHGYTFIRGTVTVPSNVNYHPITIKHFFNKDTNIRAVGTYRASYTVEERDFLLTKGATFEDEQWYHIETKGEKSPLANVCMNFINLRKDLQAQKSSSQHMAKIAANSLYGILFEAVDTYNESLVEKEIKVKRDNYYREAMQGYRKNINLTDVRDELKFVLGQEYHKLMNRWHNSKSHNKPDGVALELEQSGVFLEETNAVDIILALDDLWLKESKSTATETYKERVVARDGYRAGEFWNPLYAAIITSRTRLLMAKAADAIEMAGGKPIILMTDSITWQGTKDMMPKEFVKEIKTLGYYETPEEIFDITCLGSGRYGYRKADGYYVAKRRGLNAVDIHDPDGIIVSDTFDWQNALKIMDNQNTTNLNIKVRMLISPGLIQDSKTWTVKDLGRVVNEERNVPAIVGKSKRVYNENLKNPKLLATQLVDTEPIELGIGMTGKPGPLDQTLPFLRSELMKRKIVTKKQRRKKTNNKAVKKYHKKNRLDLNEQYRQKYAMLRKLGYEPKEATKIAHKSQANINEILERDGKLNELF